MFPRSDSEVKGGVIATTAPATETHGNGAPNWYAREPLDVISKLHSDNVRGLTAAEVAERRDEVGPNRFSEAKKEPTWHVFLRQYQDPMQIVLVVAAVGSFYPLKQLGTGIVIALLTLINAVLGMQQEGKAAAAVAAAVRLVDATLPVLGMTGSTSRMVRRISSNPAAISSFASKGVLPVSNS